MRVFVLLLVCAYRGISNTAFWSQVSNVMIQDSLSATAGWTPLQQAITATRERAQTEAQSLQTQCDALNTLKVMDYTVCNTNLTAIGHAMLRQGRCNSTTLTEAQLQQIAEGTPYTNATFSLRFGITVNETEQPIIRKFTSDVKTAQFLVQLPSNSSSLYCVVDETTLANEHRWLNLSKSMPLMSYTNALKFDMDCLNSRWSKCAVVWNVTVLECSKSVRTALSEIPAAVKSSRNVTILIDRPCQRQLPCLSSASNSSGDATTAATYTTLAFVASLISSILNLLAAILWSVASVFSIVATIFAYLSAVSASPELYGFSSGPSFDASEAAESLMTGTGSMLFGVNG